MNTDTGQAIEGEGAPPVDMDLDAAPPALTEVEEVAKEMGWRPKTEYDGPEDKWKPARDFIKADRGRRDMRNELKQLRDQVDRIATASTRQTERALREQAQEIEARFASAVENQDTAGAAAAVKELRTLETEAARSQPSTGNVEDDFARDNPWYGKDEDATAYAIGVSQREAAKGKSVAEQLAAVTEGMKKRFPELVGGDTQEPAPRKPAPAVAAPNRGALAPRAKAYGDLPPAARKAADDYAELFHTRHGKDKEASKKQYAKDYVANVGEPA